MKKGITDAQVVLLIALTVLATAWGLARVDRARPVSVAQAIPEAQKPIDTPPDGGYSGELGAKWGTCEVGLASWYGPGYHGKITARGWRSPKGAPHHRERFNMHAMTAASKTLPFGTVAHVIAIQTGDSVDVVINDRGPYIKGRIIDLSRAAMDALGGLEAGVIPVRVCYDKEDDKP